MAILANTACTTLKPNPDKTITHTLPKTSTGLLAETIRKLDLGVSQTAVLPLSDARDAFEWRLALVDHATTSIDIQYFIWSHDEVGQLLFDRLLDAADRGVRVRILVADGFDMLTSHENAWHVTLNDEDKLQWESSNGVVSTQPARHFSQRILDFFLQILPIESQL